MRVKTIERKKVSVEVAESILEIIEESNLSNGDRLQTENELAKLFGVSRSSIREAIKSLAGNGVLEIRRGIGTFILNHQVGPLRQIGAGPNQELEKTSRDIAELRHILEPEIAQLAALRRTEKDLDELKRCVDVIDNAVTKKEKRPFEDLGFHIALAKSTGNSTFVDITVLLERYYELSTMEPNTLDVIDHKSIYEAVKNRDPHGARLAMEKHLKEVEQRKFGTEIKFETV